MSGAPSFEKVAVTGGTGFIGQHLLQALVAAGHRPLAIARRMDRVSGLPNVLKERVRWIELDLLKREAVTRFVDAERPSVLFHLAGTRGIDNQNRGNTSTCRELNVEATLHLLESATRAGAERIIITGSAEEYGNQTGPLDETSELRPVSVYGTSKAEATRLALALHEFENCPVVIARLFTVYGPHQPGGMFVSDAICAAVSSESFSMSEGTQQRDLVFVDDVVRALIACARTSGIAGNVFNFGSGQPVRLRDVAQMVWRISGSAAPLVIGGRPRGVDEMDVTWANSFLAGELLGWQPRVDLESGLSATIQWARTLVSRSASKLVAL